VRWLRASTPDPWSSSTFTAKETYAALYNFYPDRFPDAPKSGTIVFKGVLHGDDTLHVMYAPKEQVAS
jgi:hypothetical protein